MRKAPGVNEGLLVFNAVAVTFCVVRYSYKVWKRPERAGIGFVFFAVVFLVNLTLSTFDGIEAVARAAATTGVYVVIAAFMIWSERRNDERSGAGHTARRDDRDRSSAS